MVIPEIIALKLTYLRKAFSNRNFPFDLLLLSSQSGLIIMNVPSNLTHDFTQGVVQRYQSNLGVSLPSGGLNLKTSSISDPAVWPRIAFRVPYELQSQISLGVNH